MIKSKLILLVLMPLAYGCLQNRYVCNSSIRLSDSDSIKAKSLNIIDLSSTELGDFPCDILKYINVTELNLFDTHLKSLPSDIDNLKNLKKLDLSWNEIRIIPKEVFNLIKLEELIFYGSPDYELQLPRLAGIHKLKNLKYLSLTSYSFKKIPQEILKLDSLEVFDLSAVGLKKLPRDIGKLKNLRKLLIQVNNDINELPSSMKDLKKLEELWMCGTGVYQKDVDSLQKALPNCMIYFSPNYGNE
jgi:Leucine-rich repeat (LRR) protein